MDGNVNGEGSPVEKHELRTKPRFSVDEESLLVFVNHGMPVKARVVDLSFEGCRLRTHERFSGKSGRPIEVSFKVKGFTFRLSGVVRWTDGKNLIGIRFEKMLPRRQVDLQEVIDEMAAAAARAEAANQIAEEQELAWAQTLAENAKAQEPGISQPVAAKKGEPQAAAKDNWSPFAVKPGEPPATKEGAVVRTAPSSADAKTPAPSSPSAQQSATSRERRTQSRHEVDTKATIFLVKVGSSLRGQIIDLSVGGCRIRTDERFPVGIYTRVETEFHLQGLPFRLGGVIQAIHNRNTVGIRFLDLSDRKRQQVTDLIEEIEQMNAERPPDDASAQAPENQTGGG